MDAQATKKRFMRLPEVLSFIPVSKTSWYRGIKQGRYPKPIKLSPNTSAWKSQDIERLIAGLSA
ncbi:MAG: AlpA family phage regulatory protein [Mariprofundaceae bacterium]|nr:AlpA family phage regulatory protein [Mariprofundaceae bacterium]